MKRIITAPKFRVLRKPFENFKSAKITKLQFAHGRREKNLLPTSHRFDCNMLGIDGRRTRWRFCNLVVAVDKTGRSKFGRMSMFIHTGVHVQYSTCCSCQRVFVVRFSPLVFGTMRHRHYYRRRWRFRRRWFRRHSNFFFTSKNNSRILQRKFLENRNRFSRQQVRQLSYTSLTTRTAPGKEDRNINQRYSIARDEEAGTNWMPTCFLLDCSLPVSFIFSLSHSRLLRRWERWSEVKWSEVNGKEPRTHGTCTDWARAFPNLQFIHLLLQKIFIHA